MNEELEQTHQAIAALSIAALTNNHADYIVKDSKGRWSRSRGMITKVEISEDTITIEYLETINNHDLVFLCEGEAIQLVDEKGLIEFNGHITTPPPADGNLYTYDEDTEQWTAYNFSLEAV